MSERRIKSIGAILVAAVLLVCLGVVNTASACGCGILLRAAEVSEKALVSYHDGVETIVPALTIDRVGPNAAVVFPVPERPGIRALPANLDIFAELEAATIPPQPESGATTGVGAAPPPHLISQNVIGGYEVTVLQGGTGQTVFAWLASHGYALPPTATPILHSYAAQGWYFVAIRLANTSSGEIQPLAITFNSRQLVYPMKLSSVASDPQSLELFVNSDGAVAAGGLPGMTTTFAASVSSLTPAPSLAVMSLLPGRYLTRLVASDVPPEEISSDIFVNIRAGAPVPVPAAAAPAASSSGGVSSWAYVVIAVALAAALGGAYRWAPRRRPTP